MVLTCGVLRMCLVTMKLRTYIKTCTGCLKRIQSNYKESKYTYYLLVDRLDRGFILFKRGLLQQKLSLYM